MSGISPGYQIGEDANLEAWPSQPSIGSLALKFLAAGRPPCTVCGTAYEKHGSYPTCASHPYSPDGRCGHVGIFADGRFTGVPCAGAECRNGCARAAGVNPCDNDQPKEPT
jgi:hypothetical protein